MTQSFDVERIARTYAMRKACLNWASLFFNHTWTSFSFDVERIARTYAMRKACLNWASLFFNHTWTSFSLTALLVLELDCFSPLFADFCPLAGVVLSKSGCLGGVCI